MGLSIQHFRKGVITLKIGVFTDPHYAKVERLNHTRRPELSLDKLKEACAYFSTEKADAIVCLGDWISVYRDKDEISNCLKEMAEVTKSTHIPVYTCMGNHDREIFTREEFAALSGAVISPCLVEDDQSALILLDANYKRNGDPWPDHYEDWTETSIPKDQMEWLEKTLSSLKTRSLSCTIAMHQVADPQIATDPSIQEGPLHVIENAEAFRSLIASYDNVSLVLQGHYHFGSHTTIGSTVYVTMKAMCEGEDNSYGIFLI